MNGNLLKHVVLSLAIMLAGDAWAGARLEVTPVTPPNGDFGRQVKNLGDYPLEYKFKNVGDQNLLFEMIHPGCGCLSIEGPKRILAPGEESEMRGVFKCADYEGHTEKSVYILTNDENIRSRNIPLTIFLPYVKTGLRFFPNTYRIMCRLKNGKMVAGPSLENGNLSVEGRKFLEEQAAKDKSITVPPPGEVDITITGARLPEGWKCLTPFPVVVKAEAATAERPKLEFVYENWDGKNFHEMPFFLLTDSKVLPALKGTLNYTTPKIRPMPKPGTQGVRVAIITIPRSTGPATPPATVTEKGAKCSRVLQSPW